jgi:putative nucleotidyltransferase with HDIG domain/PAS domain S-box-containing protein
MKRSRKAYRKMLAETATAMCSVDPRNLRIVEANRSFLNLFQYSLCEALSLTLYDLTAQDRDSVDYTCKQLLPARKVLSPLSLTALRKGGDSVVVEFLLEWIGLREGPLILVTFRNLSEHKENRFLTSLQETSRDILRHRDRDEALRSLLRRSMELVTAPHGSLWMVASDGMTIVPFLNVGYQAPRVWSQTRPGEGLAGKVWQTGQALVVNDYPRWPYRLPVPVVHEVYTVAGFPLSGSDGTVIGVLELAHCDPIRVFDWHERYYLGQMAQMAALELEKFVLLDTARQEIQERKRAELRIRDAYEALDQAYESTLIGWAQALDMRDGETQGHSRRVADMTLKLAKIVGLPEQEWVHIWRGALLHDIGKMGIPDSILLHPGPLGKREWEIMRRHPVHGVKWVEGIDYLKPAIPLIRHHHERWDGNGYPDGLRETEIPLPARIFSIVDVWDALLSTRPYRAAWTRGQVVGYLTENAGRQFDPEIVDIFLQRYQEVIS